MTIRKPCVEQVKIYLKSWKELEGYPKNECFLRKLFNKYDKNNNKHKVLIKVCTLNSLYSTNVRPVNASALAEHIVNLEIDQRIEKLDFTLVNEIATFKDKEGKNVNVFSFATKYCSFHSPKNYPIYDKSVDKMLWRFKPENNFKRKDLKCYPTFHKVLMEFIKHYKLDEFDLKEIDRYLWQAGKKLPWSPLNDGKTVL